MIYGNMILEDHLEKLIDPATIMQEYYENEISFLNSVIEYQNESFVTESTELEALHEGFIENVKNTIKGLIKRFIEFLNKLSKAIKNKFTKEKSDKLKKLEKRMESPELDDLDNQIKDIDDKLKDFGEKLRKEEEDLKRYQSGEEYEIRCFSSELTDAIRDYNSDIYAKHSSILSNLKDLIRFVNKDLANDISNDLDDLLSDNKSDKADRDNKKIDDIINKINDEIKESNPRINFSKYIIKYKTSNKFEITKIFTGVETAIRKGSINSTLANIDKCIDKCKKLLTELDKSSKTNGEADKTKVSKIMKAINTSITYMQKSYSDMVKMYNEYEGINNKLMDEALSKIRS